MGVMKNRWGILMLGLCLVAFLGGFGAKRLAHSSGSSRETEQEAATEKGAKSARFSFVQCSGQGVREWISRWDSFRIVPPLD